MDRFDRIDILAQPERDAGLAQLVSQRIHNLGINKWQEFRALVDQRYSNPQSSEHAGILTPDHTCTNNGQSAWYPVEPQYVIAGNDLPAVERNMRIHRRF